MSAQFIHINTYARASKTWKGTDKKGNAKGGTTSSIRQIVDEAIREPGACPHVEQPLPPVVLFGVPAGEIPEMCEQYAATMKDAAGKKLAKSGLVCIAGVVSVGAPDQEKWDQVKADSIKFLQEKYGDRLKSVVEHQDEAYKHFHFYVIPRPGEKLEDIHEGIKARNDSRRLGEKMGTQNRKYREAMKGLQDAYSIKVSARNGLTRIGPSRRRLSRDGWRAEQAAAVDLAKKLNIYEDAKKVGDAGYKTGHKKGFAQGLKKGLEAANNLGDKVGTFFRSILGPLHKPTALVARQLEEAKEQIKQENKAKEEAVAAAKSAQEYAEASIKEQFQNVNDWAKTKIKQPDNHLKTALKLEQEQRKEAEDKAAEALAYATETNQKNIDLTRRIKELEKSKGIV
jgi:hypothetical protein